MLDMELIKNEFGLDLLKNVFNTIYARNNYAWTEQDNPEIMKSLYSLSTSALWVIGRNAYEQEDSGAVERIKNVCENIYSHYDYSKECDDIEYVGVLNCEIEHELSKVKDLMKKYICFEELNIIYKQNKTNMINLKK